MSLQSSQRGDLQPFCILIKSFPEIFSHAPSGQKISRAVPDRSPCSRHRRSQSVVPVPIVPRSPSFQCPSPPSPRRPSFLAHPQTRLGQSGDRRQSTDHRPTRPVRYSREGTERPTWRTEFLANPKCKALRRFAYMQSFHLYLQTLPNCKPHLQSHWRGVFYSFLQIGQCKVDLQSPWRCSNK